MVSERDLIKQGKPLPGALPPLARWLAQACRRLPAFTSLSSSLILFVKSPINGLAGVSMHAQSGSLWTMPTQRRRRQTPPPSTRSRSRTSRSSRSRTSRRTRRSKSRRGTRTRGQAASRLAAATTPSPSECGSVPPPPVRAAGQGCAPLCGAVAVCRDGMRQRYLATPSACSTPPLCVSSCGCTCHWRGLCVERCRLPPLSHPAR